MNARLTAFAIAATAAILSGTPTAAQQKSLTGTRPVVTGPVSAVAADVRVFDGATAAPTGSILAFKSSTPSGVPVALGDVNGDGYPEIITGRLPDALPQVRVFDGLTGAKLFDFLAYPARFRGGVFVAAGDVTGDGRADIITAPGPGMAPVVTIFDGETRSVVGRFFAYAPTFLGGVHVAAGDITGDGRADIVTAPATAAPPHVKVFDGTTFALSASFFAYAPSFTGGVFVAVGDVDGVGTAEIITGPGPGASPQVKAFDSSLTLVRSFFAYDAGFLGGVTVAAGQINGGPDTDIITGVASGGSPHVKIFDGATLSLAASFLAYSPAYGGGVYVAGDAETAPHR
jgi:hypothetical protein